MSRIIDKNGRLLGKVSVIDLLVVLVVAFIAVALNLRGSMQVTNTSSADTPITFTCLVECIPTNVAEAIQVGDSLYDVNNSSGSGPLGIIQQVERLPGPGSKTELLPSGRFTTLTNEDYCNLLLTVKGSGRVSNGHYVINRVYELGVNAARTYYTAYAEFNGTISQIL